MIDIIRWISKDYVLPAIAGGVILFVFCIVLLATRGTSDNSTHCITSADCTPDRTCVDRKCEDACSKCGAHTFCHVTNHVPYCSCIHGFEGNPLTGCTPGPNTHAAIKECTTDDQCSQDLACKDHKCQDPCQGVCGVNAVCHVSGHHPACACNPGYTGDPFKSCQKQKPQCDTNDQCSNDLACIQHECKDPCLGACGINTHCTVKIHHSSCSCVEGYTGNPLHGCQRQENVKRPSTGPIGQQSHSSEEQLSQSSMEGSVLDSSKQALVNSMEQRILHHLDSKSRRILMSDLYRFRRPLVTQLSSNSKEQHPLINSVEDNPFESVTPPPFTTRSSMEQNSHSSVEESSHDANPTPKTPPTPIRKSFHVFTDKKVNWYRALHECQSKDLSLASIDDEEQYQHLLGEIIDAGLSGNDENFWISGFDLLKTGKYIWYTSKRPIDFAKWGPGEPNGLENENCVELRAEQGYKMNDQECTDKLYYVCES